MEKTIKTDHLILKTTESKSRDVLNFELYSGNGTQVGLASLEVSREGETVHLDIYINPEYRRLGYGLEAGDALIDEIIKGYPKYEIIAAVPCDDEVANRFCERLDFIFDCTFADENANIYYM